MRPIAGSEAAEGSIALERLRRDLDPALDALDRAAAEPDRLEEFADDLPALQYALHAAAERALGIEPVAGLEHAHDELETALEIAREETADMAEVLDDAGAIAASALVWEWRGALFGVRLALRRLGEGTLVVPAAEPEPRGAILPVVLVAIGVLVVLGGALGDEWPLWGVGLAFVAASTVLSHRRA